MNPELFRHGSSERSASARDWRTAQVEALALADYEADWDGEGASPVPKPLIDSAIRFFREMQQLQLPAPDSVYPLPIGSVMAEWHYDDQTVVSAEIRTPGKAEVLVWHPAKKSVFQVVTWDDSPARRRVVRVVTGKNLQRAWDEVSALLASLGNQPRMDIVSSEVMAQVETQVAAHREGSVARWEAVLAFVGQIERKPCVRGPRRDERYTSDGDHLALSA